MKKNIFLWGLYDFGNTFITAAITGLYLSQWVIVDNKFADIWYGTTFTFATIVLLITSPFWGTWSDKIGKRMPFLTGATMVLVFLGILLGLITNAPLPVFQKVLCALGIFFILQYVYQISLIFLDALLYQIATAKTVGKISGIGDAFSQLSWIVGPVSLLPFATGTITLFGNPGRSQVFLPAATLTAIFTLPMLLWFREPLLKTHHQIKSPSLFRDTIKGLTYLIKKDKNVLLYLLSFMFISDAVLTMTLFFGVFLGQRYSISDSQIVTAMAIMELVAIPASLLLGKISDRYGSKNIHLIGAINLAIGFLLMSILNNVNQLYIIAAFIGIGFSSYYVCGRALLIKISPVARLGEYFGFYGTFQRFASIIGPLTWGLVTYALKDSGAVKYQWAGISMTVLMGIGILLLLKVKEQRR